MIEHDSTPPESTYERLGPKQVNIVPNGRAHLALKCWEAFAWQHIAVQSLQACNDDHILQTHAGFAQMIFPYIFNEQYWTPHHLVSFEVGRKEGGESHEDKRWRIRSVIYRVRTTVGDEKFEDDADVPVREIIVEFGHYDP